MLHPCTFEGRASAHHMLPSKGPVRLCARGLNCVARIVLSRVSREDARLEKYAGCNPLFRDVIAGFGSYPLVGTPEQIVDGLQMLVLPLLKQAGLR